MLFVVVLCDVLWQINQTDRQNIETRKKYERDCDEQKVEVLKETEIRQTKIQQKNATLENQIIAAQTTADARLTSGGASLRVRLFFLDVFFLDVSSYITVSY